QTATLGSKALERCRLLPGPGHMRPHEIQHQPVALAQVTTRSVQGDPGEAVTGRWQGERDLVLDAGRPGELLVGSLERRPPEDAPWAAGRATPGGAGSANPGRVDSAPRLDPPDRATGRFPYGQVPRDRYGGSPKRKGGQRDVTVQGKSHRRRSVHRRYLDRDEPRPAPAHRVRPRGHGLGCAIRE